MADERERETPEEPVDDSIPTPVYMASDDDSAGRDELPDTAPLSDDAPDTDDLSDDVESPADARANAPYQWRDDDVVWPVTYGEPLHDPRAPVEAQDEMREFVIYESSHSPVNVAAPHVMPDISAGTPEERAPAEAPKPPSVFGWLRHLFAGTPPDEQQRRLERLNYAIDQNPNMPANYVLRGELYLMLGAREQAADDFRAALDLADMELEHRDWGIVAQAMQDRALVGLRRAGGKGKRKR